MKRLGKAMALFTSGSVLGTVTQVIKGKLAAVLLGAHGMGVLGQLTNVWGLVNTVSGLGFYNGVVRRIAQARSEEDSEALFRQLSSALLFVSGFSCLVALGTTVLASHISDMIFADGGAHASLVAIILLSVPFAVTAQTYRGLLSGHQLVKPIVAAQVISDVLSLPIYAALVYGFGLWGAVLGFCSLHVMKLLIQLATVRRALGSRFVLPRPSDFSWPEVKINAGYGVNGLLMSALSILTVTVISRWIIAAQGLPANGVFFAAWKVGTLYFGAIYAAAGGYYFPSLAASRNNEELSFRINEAVTLYQFIMPPIIIFLVIGGPLLMILLFSKEFQGAATLMTFMLPGDLFRIASETIGLAFLARGNLVKYSVSYIVWAALFLALAFPSIARFGIVGVSYAYAASHFIYFLFVAWLAYQQYRYKLSWQALRSICLGVGAAAAAAAVTFVAAGIWLRYVMGVLVFMIWLLMSLRDPSFKILVGAVVKRLRK